MITLNKLKPGDKVAIISPSAQAQDIWPEVYKVGVSRIKEVFGLEPVEYFTKDRAAGLIAAFTNQEIRAVITTLGGDDQVTYVKNLPKEPFLANPKPFFGFSDNTHLCNFLWLLGIPSFYGGAIMTQFAMQGKMDDFTVAYLKKALFTSNEVELTSSHKFNDIGLNWFEPEGLSGQRVYEKNPGWSWDGNQNDTGILWGGCMESLDEMFRHNIQIPSLKDFKEIVLLTETSEGIPDNAYAFWFYRALGERGILKNIRAVLVGRPKTWHFNKQLTTEQKTVYKDEQRKTILETVRRYNSDIPVIQNLDFGHTDPQICMPYGSIARIDSENKKIFAQF